MIQGHWFVDTAVRAFHEKHGIPSTHYEDLIPNNQRVAVAAEGLKASSRILKNHDDPVELRAHLLCEELGEFLQALCDKDPIEMLDGLADLLHVVLGTAIQLELPLAEAFDEVCRSNMTKEVSDGPRVRGKGEGYSPPNLAPLLDLQDRTNDHGF